MRKKPDERAGFAAAYGEGLGLAAVAVLCDADGARIIAPNDNFSLSVAANAHARWWCRRVDDAARVAAVAARMLRRESNNTAPSTVPVRAKAAVLAAAEKLNIALHSDQDIADAAMNVVARVDAELQQQRSNGGLKSVNQAYRSYRLETSGRGERVLRYDEWMRAYRQKLVRQIASALR